MRGGLVLERLPFSSWVMAFQGSLQEFHNWLCALHAFFAVFLQTENSLQFNFICIALNHHHSLKGLNMPNIYDTPLCKPPQGQEKTPLNQQGRNLEKERMVRDPCFQCWSGVHWGP